MDDWLDWWWPIFAFLGGVLVVGIVVAAIYDEREWQAFKVAQHCRKVGEVSGSVATGVGPIIGGKGGVAVTSTYIPGKTGWLCDDGVTYWR